MNKETIERIAGLIHAYYDDKLEYEELFRQGPELDSAKELSHLLGLIEHQPGRKGLFGSDTSAEYEEHKTAVLEELRRLIDLYS